MSKIATFLDSTYLKTEQQSGLNTQQTLDVLYKLCDEAIENEIFAIMIRPKFIKELRYYIDNKKSLVKLGTVIGFHEGHFSTEYKLAEAKKAIEDGADELDFVVHYSAFLNKALDEVKEEFLEGTKLCLDQGKIVKWIIEIAALSNKQIADLSGSISQWATENFSEKLLSNIFIKSSTGYYPTSDGKPNGATFEGIKIMLEHAGKLSVKAAGGVKTPDDAEKMIKMGVKRIGTSSALALLQGKASDSSY